MKELRKIALGVVILIAAVGGALIFFNILDFKIEATRIHPSTSMLYTLPVAAVALSAAFTAAKAFTVTGSRQLFWLGCGALAFGVGNLMRSWGGHDMNLAITIKDSANLIAVSLFLVGVSLSMPKQHITGSGGKPELRTVLFSYLGVVMSLAVITLLVFLSIIPPFHLPGQSATALRNIVQLISIVFSVASALICLKIYYVSRQDFSYWYFLGLVLFTLALLFGSQSTIDSLLSWLGRISQFISGVYLLMAAVGSLRPAGAVK
jgi:hypothetical protein